MTNPRGIVKNEGSYFRISFLGWNVVSLPAQSKTNQKHKASEIAYALENAYRAGRESKLEEIKNALEIKDPEEGA